MPSRQLERVLNGRKKKSWSLFGGRGHQKETESDSENKGIGEEIRPRERPKRLCRSTSWRKRAKREKKRGREGKKLRPLLYQEAGKRSLTFYPLLK